MLTSRLGMGGAERHSITLANALSAQLRVGVAYLKPEEDLLDALATERLFTVHSLRAGARIDTRAVRELAELVQTHRVQVIVTANAYALMYAHLARGLCKQPLSVVQVFHTTGLVGLKAHLAMAFYRPWFWATHHSVFVCEAQRRHWRNRGLWSRRVHTIPNGVDTQHFNPTDFAAPAAKLRAQLGWRSSDRVVGLCAVLRPEKAHHLLVQAVAQLHARGQAWRVLIVGDGPLRTELEHTIARAGLRGHVHITGYLADVRTHLAACDVVALPSTSETFSLAALEAMAMARPVVLSDVGGAREQVIHGRHGYLFASGDALALAEALRRLWQTPHAQTLGAAARQRVVQQFSLHGMVERYRALLEPLCQALWQPRPNANGRTSLSGPAIGPSAASNPPAFSGASLGTGPTPDPTPVLNPLPTPRSSPLPSPPPTPQPGATARSGPSAPLDLSPASVADAADVASPPGPCPSEPPSSDHQTSSHPSSGHPSTGLPSPSVPSPSLHLPGLHLPGLHSPSLHPASQPLAALDAAAAGPFPVAAAAGAAAATATAPSAAAAAAARAWGLIVPIPPQLSEDEAAVLQALLAHPGLGCVLATAPGGSATASSAGATAALMNAAQATYPPPAKARGLEAALRRLDAWLFRRRHDAHPPLAMPAPPSTSCDSDSNIDTANAPNGPGPGLGAPVSSEAALSLAAATAAHPGWPVLNLFGPPSASAHPGQPPSSGELGLGSNPQPHSEPHPNPHPLPNPLSNPLSNPQWSLFIEGLPLARLHEAVRSRLGQPQGALRMEIRTQGQVLFQASSWLDHRSLARSRTLAQRKVSALVQGALARAHVKPGTLPREQAHPSTSDGAGNGTKAFSNALSNGATERATEAPTRAAAGPSGQAACSQLPASTPPALSSRAWLGRMAQSVLQRLLWRDQWRVQVWELLSAAAAEPARLLATLQPPPGAFWADPFILRRPTTAPASNGPAAVLAWVFIEELAFDRPSRGGGKGRISVIEVYPDGRHSAPRLCIDEPWHLSYPQVFEDDGQLFMVPESCENGTVDLYVCTQFPQGWQRVASLLRGVRMADATLFRWQGRWWMMGAQASPGASLYDELHLYHAPSLHGPWQPHALNPVKIDAGSARPGGAVFVHNGQLIRPAQDTRDAYGSGLHFMDITELSPTAFSEIPTTWAPGDAIVGFAARRANPAHTFNHDGPLAVSDERGRCGR